MRQERDRNVASRDELWIASNAGCEKASTTVAGAAAPLAVENHRTVFGSWQCGAMQLGRKNHLVTDISNGRVPALRNQGQFAHQERRASVAAGGTQENHLNDDLGKKFGSALPLVGSLGFTYPR